ncbi:glutaredoxin family protein [Methylomonas sp. SURF-2]|uniref:Glutaredoxin family protein n=1 Tax=Methylomonas subterranea TaxID=2952225 RepID=A0ABT1TE79_9GAMM|nr:glutaredoxin family protein [Methylomonas sp. SURF-2]
MLCSIRQRRCLWRRCIWAAIFCVWLPIVAASESSALAGVLRIYVRDGCPHCAEAKKFLPTIAAQRPGLKIVYRSLDRDPAARDELFDLSRRHGVWPPGVPTFVMHDKLLVGFDDAASSGPALLSFIDNAVSASRVVDAGWFGDISVERLGLPMFTLALGLLDGFNPCAMWVLLFLLSFLIRLQNRRRMALVAGTFVLVSGAVYYAFMAAWLNVFLIMGMSDPVRWVLAGLALAVGAVNVKDFFAFKQGLSFSIPETAKPGLYARMRQLLRTDALAASLLSVTVLAILVNFIELLCTAGLPAIYTAVLSQQGLSMMQYYAYLLLYILAYIADDSLMVAIAVFTLGSRKLTEQSGRWLKLLSGAVMLALAATMLLRPDWLL